MAMSPASSPRLPSPPPIAEDQIGPKSPLAGLMDELEVPENFSQGASRRIRPGTKAADMPEGPPLVELTEVDLRSVKSLESWFMAKWLQIDTAFQLTEHLKALYSAAIHPDGSETIVPIDRAMAIKLAQPPEGVEKALWLYELCRFLCQKINSIIVALFADEPPCSSLTCPEMRASEWQYLCAVHDPPKPCCAIDYCCHTLDWAANILTSPKHFPSRLSLNPEASQGHQPLRQLTNIFRRVYRIFAHAWFQHREVFWRVENKTGLYIFFKTVCDMYGLIPEENYTVPPEAEGLETVAQDPQLESRPAVLQKLQAEHRQDSERGEEGAAGSIASGHTTQRHNRQTAISDTSSIATVIEESEEEEKGEAAAEDSTEMETPVAPQQSEHSAFASAVQGHPDTPEEKEPEEVEAALANLTLAEPTEQPEIVSVEAATAEEEQLKTNHVEALTKEDPENEVAETTDGTHETEGAAETAPQVDTTDIGAEAKDAETKDEDEAGKSSED